MNKNEILDINDMDYMGETIKLGGKKRILLYGMGGMAVLAKAHGSVMKSFEVMDNMAKGITLEDLDALVTLVYAGLCDMDEEITEAEIRKMITFRNMHKILTVLTRCFVESLPETKDEVSSATEKKN